MPEDALTPYASNPGVTPDGKRPFTVVLMTIYSVENAGIRYVSAALQRAGIQTHIMLSVKRPGIISSGMRLSASAPSTRSATKPEITVTGRPTLRLASQRITGRPHQCGFARGSG